MAIDPFETRTLLQAVEMMKPARTFLRDTFFTDVQTSMTENVDIDIIKGARRVAPFIHPRLGSKTVDAIGYSTVSFTPPNVGVDYNFTGKDLQKRLPGENIYSGQTPDSRMAKLIGGKLGEFDTMISRREEWMCAQAMCTGQIPIIGDGYNFVIDYQLTNKETLSGTDLWSNAASDPIQYLKNKTRAVIKGSGFAPNVCLMSSDVGDAYMKNVNVLKYLDTHRTNINIGTIDPRQTQPGVFFIGHINELNLDLYSYEEYFIDPTDGVEKSLIPAGTLILCSSLVNFKMFYGCIIDVEQGSFAMSRVPKSWTIKKPSARVLQLLSKPLPAITLPDAMFVSKVL